MANKTMTIILPGGGTLAAAGVPGSKGEDYEASPGKPVRVFATYGQSMIDDGIAKPVEPKATSTKADADAAKRATTDANAQGDGANGAPGAGG